MGGIISYTADWWFQVKEQLARLMEKKKKIEESGGTFVPLKIPKGEFLSTAIPPWSYADSYHWTGVRDYGPKEMPIRERVLGTVRPCYS